MNEYIEQTVDKAKKEKKVKKGGRGFRIVLLICLLAAGVLAAYRVKKNSLKEEDTVPLPSVTVQKPEKATIVQEISLTATKVPGSVWYVVPKAAGEITEVLVKQGDTVAQGDVLCRIDNSKAIEAARISLDGAKVQVATCESTVALAEKSLERMRVLYQSGDIAKQTFEQTESSCTQAKAALEAARFSLEGAQLQYNSQVEFASITAPAAGRLETCDMVVGSIATQTSPLAVISGNGGKLQFNVTDRVLSALYEGEALRAEKQGTVYDCVITSLATMPGATTGLYQVEASVNDEGKLVTGAAVKVTFPCKKAENVLTVGSDAVYYDNGKTYVYLADTDGAAAAVTDEGGKSEGETDGKTDGKADGKAGEQGMVLEGAKRALVHRTEVQTGLSDEKRTQILGGIGENAAVIATWTGQLYEGALVQVLPAEGGNA